MNGDVSELIGTIYEAGAMPDRWPNLLTKLADRFDAKGAILMRHNGEGRRWIVSPSIEPMMEEFVERGWMNNNPRIDRYNSAAPYAGFQIDDDFMPRAEFEAWPIYQEFFVPHGLETGAGTVVQGAKEDGLLITIEGLGSPDEARKAVPILDHLRPHLARASVLASQLNLRKIEAALQALAIIGAAAAMVDEAGRIEAANGEFEKYRDLMMSDRQFKLFITNQRSRPGAASGNRPGISMPLSRADSLPAVLHLLPVEGDARDIFRDTMFIAIIVDPIDHSVPSTDIIQLLFDLSPKEALLAKMLSEHKPLSLVSKEMNITRETAKSHLSSIFIKMGINRQVDLIKVISRVAVP